MVEHQPARSWLDDRLENAARVGLPWQSLLGFVRVVSQPRLFDPPVAIAVAWRQVEAWLDADPSWIPTATRRHRNVLGSLMHVVSAPRFVSDAHLAALAIEHGLTLCSTDGDFARFPGLRWENPLVS